MELGIFWGIFHGYINVDVYMSFFCETQITAYYIACLAQQHRFFFFIVVVINPINSLQYLFCIFLIEEKGFLWKVTSQGDHKFLARQVMVCSHDSGRELL